MRFDYITACGSRRWFGVAESVLLFSGMFVLAVLLYIRKNILKPFHRLSDLAFELSKGHLQGELEEGKNRFFGKFVWGIAMLRDSLSTAKAQALKLEKDKKMLLLSLSHDIKIPLSTIQLYAKALKESVYQTEEQKLYAAAQIAGHAAEIEQFVKEIITTSSEDILAITVEEGEFYLKALMNKVQKVYAPKCRLAMTEFQIGSYADKLLKGDIPCQQRNCRICLTAFTVEVMWRAKQEMDWGCILAEKLCAKWAANYSRNGQRMECGSVWCFRYVKEIGIKEITPGDKSIVEAVVYTNDR